MIQNIILGMAKSALTQRQQVLVCQFHVGNKKETYLRSRVNKLTSFSVTVGLRATLRP